MLVAANACLGRTYDSEQIGYSVLDLAGRVVKPWTKTGVKKDFPGWWSVVGGVDVPDAGGFIRWGTGSSAIAQESVLPLPALDMTAITRRLDSLVGSLQRATTTAVGEMASQQEAVSELLQTQGEDILAIRQWCDQVAGITRIGTELDAMQRRLGRLLGGQQPQPTPSPVTELAAAERAQYEAQIGALQSKLNGAVAVIDKYLAQMEGR